MNTGIAKQPADVIRDITRSFWRCPIFKLRDAMREAKIIKGAKILAIMTPVGVYHAIFMTSSKQLGIMIRHPGGIPGWFSIEMKIEDLMADENQEKEVLSIAHMRCDWQRDYACN